jgi:hypothetical protein
MPGSIPGIKTKPHSTGKVRKAVLFFAPAFFTQPP